MTLRSFWRQSYLSFRGLFLWLSAWAYISNAVAAPIVLIAIFVFTSRFSNASVSELHVVTGMAMFGMWSMISGGITQSLAYERAFGTLPFLYLSPSNRAGLYFSKGLLHVPSGLLTGLIALTAGFVLFDFERSASGVLLGLAVLVLIAASMAAFAMAVGNLALVLNDWLAVNGVVYGGLFALGGIVVPTSALPPGVYHFSQLLPLSHGLTALRAALRGESFSAFQGDVLAELAVGLAYAAVGIVAFVLIERRVKANGSFYE